MIYFWYIIMHQTKFKAKKLANSCQTFSKVSKFKYFEQDMKEYYEITSFDLKKHFTHLHFFLTQKALIGLNNQSVNEESKLFFSKFKIVFFIILFHIPRGLSQITFTVIGWVGSQQNGNLCKLRQRFLNRWMVHRHIFF